MSRRHLSRERRKERDEQYMETLFSDKYTELETETDHELDRIYERIQRNIADGNAKALNNDMVKLSKMAEEYEIDIDNPSFRRRKMIRNVMTCLESSSPIEVKYPAVCFLTNIFQRNVVLPSEFDIGIVYQVRDCLSNRLSDELSFVAIQCLTNMVVHKPSIRDIVINPNDGKIFHDVFSSTRICEILMNAAKNEAIQDAIVNFLSSLCVHELTEPQFYSIFSSCMKILQSPLEHVWRSAIRAFLEMSYFEETNAKLLVATLINEEKLVYLFDMIFKEERNETLLSRALRLFSNMMICDPAVAEEFVKYHIGAKEKDAPPLFQKILEMGIDLRKEMIMTMTNTVRMLDSNRQLGIECLDLDFVIFFVEALLDVNNDIDFVEAILCALVPLKDWDHNAQKKKFEDVNFEEALHTLQDSEDPELSELACAFERYINHKPKAAFSFAV